MESKKTKILILEDDETLGRALKEALARDGACQVFLTHRADEANSVLSTNGGIDFILCDCLLPQMTGLDFIAQARVTHPSSKFKVILMSGIYTDKIFVKEACESTRAVAFLKKPFEISELLKLVKVDQADRISSETLSARKMLYQIFASPSVTSRQKRRVIDSVEEVSGFDLPFLYSLLAETKSSGYLNIYNLDGSVSGVSFCDGNIVGVDLDDKATFLGEMIIQNGFSTPRDVQNALRDKNTRRLGDYLIQNNQLSPHAFDLILMEQMNIRLSRTILDQKIRVSFVSADVEMSSPCIDVDSLTDFLHDWIASKISVSWLKSLYVMWSGHFVVKSPAFREDHPTLTMSLVKSLDSLTLKLNNQVTLSQLLDSKGYNELAVYKALHFLLTKGLIIFAHRSAFASPQEQLKVLKKIWAELEGKNSYQVTAYMEAASAEGSLEKSLEEFLMLLGEEPSEPQSEVHSIWLKIRQVAQDAISMSHDAQKVGQFREATQKSEADAKLKAASLLEEARKVLQLNQFSKALEMLTEVLKLNPEAPQIHLYISWAKLGSMDPTKKLIVLKEVELELLQVPPDERYDTLFPFVSGLLSKSKGDLVNARKSFDKSVALDSSFIPARRELSLLSASAKPQDVFNMDLKQVVSGFFKKR